MENAEILQDAAFQENTCSLAGNPTFVYLQWLTPTTLLSYNRYIHITMIVIGYLLRYTVSQLPPALKGWGL
jgi:hypothetical protein